MREKCVCYNWWIDDNLSFVFFLLSYTTDLVQTLYDMLEKIQEIVVVTTRLIRTDENRCVSSRITMKYHGRFPEVLESH